MKLGGGRGGGERTRRRFESSVHRISAGVRGERTRRC